ncbi:MAG: surface-adhesin E family protein [Pseudomonadota bacterium]
MRIFITAAAAILALAPAYAAAQSSSWYRVGGNAKQMSYVDLGSVRPLGGKIIAVTKSVYKDQLNGDTGIFSTEIRSEYDCPGNYFRTLEYTYFGVAGSKISTEPSQSINEHKTPAAGSINEAMLEFICYRKGGTPVTSPYSDAAQQIPLMAD